MSDLILDIIKQFLYERQLGQEGKLDGALYLCKGDIKNNIVPHKSILPCFMIMERWQGFHNQIYYKCYVNPALDDNLNEEFKVINHKNDCQIHFFKKPMGAILLIMGIIQKVRDQIFTFISDGNAIQSYFTKFSNSNYDVAEPRIQVLVQNVLSHFEFVDFQHHQYFNKYV